MATTLDQLPEDFCPDCDDTGVIVMTGNDPINIERCDSCGLFETDEQASLVIDCLHLELRHKNREAAKKGLRIIDHPEDISGSAVMIAVMKMRLQLQRVRREGAT